MNASPLALPLLLNRRPAWVPVGILYLLLADFWLIKLAGFGMWPAFSMFGLFLAMYISSGERPLPMEIDRPLALTVSLFLGIFCLNVLLGRGESAAAVLVRYVILLSYLVTGYGLCRWIGFMRLALLLFVPYVLRAVLAFPTLLAHSGEIYSISEQLLDQANQSDGMAILSSAEFMAGVGSYTLYAAFALLSPVVLGIALESPRRVRTWLLWGLLPLAANVFLSGYLLPILLWLIGMSLVLLMRVRRTLGNVLLAAVSAAALFGLIQLLTFIPIVQTMYDKALLVFDVVNAGGVSMDPTGRGQLAQISIHTFAQHPLFGAGPYEFGAFPFQTIGGHSALLDWLAQYGLIALLFFAAILREIGRAARHLRARGHVELARGLRAMQILILTACVVNPLFLKESLDLVIFALLGGLAALNCREDACL
jgi:hypothetical protein